MDRKEGLRVTDNRLGLRDLCSVPNSAITFVCDLFVTSIFSGSHLLNGDNGIATLCLGIAR